MSAQSVPNAGAVYYVTERSNAGVARVNVDATGHATVINGYISGLPGSGPDSVIFAHSGHMLVSNSDVGTMSEIDPSSRTILRSPLNTTLVPEIADMALDPPVRRYSRSAGRASRSRESTWPAVRRRCSLQPV